MERALRMKAVVRKGGVVEVSDESLPQGAEVDVIVLLGEKREDRPPLASMIGAGKGAFKTPEDADRFINELRDEWED